VEHHRLVSKRRDPPVGGTGEDPHTVGEPRRKGKDAAGIRSIGVGSGRRIGRLLAAAGLSEVGHDLAADGAGVARDGVLPGPQPPASPLPTNAVSSGAMSPSAATWSTMPALATARGMP
jgi:hypothetical protein